MPVRTGREKLVPGVNGLYGALGRLMPRPARRGSGLQSVARVRIPLASTFRLTPLGVVL
jgi:hypothetical protein